MRLRLLLGLAVAVAAFVAGWSVNGWRMGERMASLERDLADARTAAATHARRVESLSAGLAARTAEIHDLRQALQDAADQVTIREVIRYVQTDPAAGSCVLPDSWLRIDARSATGAAQDNAAGPGADGAAARDAAADY